MYSAVRTCIDAVMLFNIYVRTPYIRTYVRMYNRMEAISWSLDDYARYGDLRHTASAIDAVHWPELFLIILRRSLASSVPPCPFHTRHELL